MWTMKPLPALDPLLERLNDALRGANFPLSRLFADYDSKHDVYRVAYKVSKGYRRIARFTALEVGMYSSSQIRALVAAQCNFAECVTDDKTLAV